RVEGPSESADLKALVFAIVFLFSLGASAQAALSAPSAGGLPAGLGAAAGATGLVLFLRRAPERWRRRDSLQVRQSPRGASPAQRGRGVGVDERRCETGVFVGRRVAGGATSALLPLLLRSWRAIAPRARESSMLYLGVTVGVGAMPIVATSDSATEK